MQITQSFLTKNRCYQTGRKIAVKGLMLHSIGCPQPSASLIAKSWNNSKAGACVHAFIDANTGEVIQTLPWNHRAWHGGGSSNDTHIGVEMCEPPNIRYTSGSRFTCADPQVARKYVITAYNSAVELFAFLCKEFNLNPLTDIVSHDEGGKTGIAADHDDPEHLWTQLDLPYTMDGFRQDVLSEMEDDDMTQEKFNEMMNNYLNELASQDSDAWAKESLEWAVQNGLMQGGNNKKLMGRKFITRQEVATLFHRFFKILLKMDGGL